MRQMAHESNPGPEHRKAEEQRPRTGDGEHDDGILESQRDEGAQPQTNVRCCPRPGGGQQPPHDHPQVPHPARHDALPSATENSQSEYDERQGESGAGRDRHEQHTSEPEPYSDNQATTDRGHGQRPNRGVTVTRGAASRHDRSHPREERSQHPPDREIPPRAATADGVPCPRERAEGTQQHDVDRHEYDRTPQPHGCSTRHALGRPGRREETGQESRGNACREHDDHQEQGRDDPRRKDPGHEEKEDDGSRGHRADNGSTEEYVAKFGSVGGCGRGGRHRAPYEQVVEVGRGWWRIVEVGVPPPTFTNLHRPSQLQFNTSRTQRASTDRLPPTPRARDTSPAGALLESTPRAETATETAPPTRAGAAAPARIPSPR